MIFDVSVASGCIKKKTHTNKPLRVATKPKPKPKVETVFGKPTKVLAKGVSVLTKRGGVASAQ